MLIYTKKNLLPVIPGIISVQLPTKIDGYLHIDLSTYRQATLLANEYETYGALIKALYNTTPVRRESVEDLYNEMNYHNCLDVRALIPMLYNCEEEVFGYEEQFGALNILSMYVRPYDITKQTQFNTIDSYPLSNSFKREIQIITATYEATCINYTEMTNPGIIREKERYPIFVLGGGASMENLQQINQPQPEPPTGNQPKVEADKPKVAELDMDPELEKMLLGYTTSKVTKTGEVISGLSTETVAEIINDSNSEYSEVFQSFYRRER